MLESSIMMKRMRQAVALYSKR